MVKFSKGKRKKVKGKSEEAGIFAKNSIIDRPGFRRGNDRPPGGFFSLTFSFFLLPFTF
jgi:hypothetical protein